MKKILILLLTIGLFYSCSDLEEEVLDTAMQEDLLSGTGAAEGVLSAAYARMNTLFNGHECFFILQEGTTDECIVPYRGGTDWYNGGRLIELYTHNISTSNADVSDVWSRTTAGVARCAIAMNTISGLDADATNTLYYAEARALCAFYNYMALDLWGLAFKKDPTDLYAETVILRGEDAFDYIISELDAAKSDLKTKSDVGAGRFTQAAVSALKARMYLNKPFYTDPYATSFTFDSDDLDNVIDYCDEVISNTAEYSFETTDYFKIFDMDNHNHSEHIFVYDQREGDYNNGNRYTWFTLARNQYGSLTNLSSTGTDGGAITSDFYATWDGNHNDPRFYKEIIAQDGSVTSVSEANWALNRGLLVGQQYGIVLDDDGGDFKRDSNGDLVIEALYNTKRTGEAVNFTVAVDLTTNTGHSCGVRVSKYEYDPNCTNGRNYGMVDMPILRLADVYLMRAEAKFRNSDSDGALTDMNALRTARNHPTQFTSSDMSLETIYNERGYELYWELVRRTDMIRFGKFEDSWSSKTDSDVNSRLFPIPQTAVDANPELLEQNEGY